MIKTCGRTHKNVSKDYDLGAYTFVLNLKMQIFRDLKSVSG
mgnify:CR=1 FL=1